LCICAFRSNQFKKVEILIRDSYPEFINHPVFMICQQIEKSEFSEEFFEKLSGKISCIDRNSKTIIRSLYFEQLRKVKGISAVKDLLVNEIEKNSKSQWHLIQLIGLAKNEVETDSIIKILKRVDQKPDDVPIENAIQAARLANEYGLLMHISNAVVQWEKKWILSPEMKIIGAEYKLSKGRFSEAKNQLLEIKENQDTLSDVILLDCLSTLNCRYEDFPFGISHILQLQKSVVGKWADMHPINFTDCFDLRLLEIEVLMKNKSQKYEKLLKSQDLLTQKQKSQLLAVLGKSYFEEKRFDLAIINLKESLNYYCDNFIIFELIVKSYTNLQLWEEAIYQINTWLENESFSVNQLIRFQDHFHGSEQWIKFLQRKSEILPENDIYLVALSSCMAKSGRIDHAKKILSRIDFQSNNNQNITFPYIQALINCGEDITAERTIQVYLSGTRYLTPQDYLVCAAFYEKLQNLEKAIYTLRLINLKYFQVAAYKSYLLEKNTNFKEALYEILSAIEYYLNGREISELMDIDSPFIPAYIKQLLAERDLIWDNAVHLCILEGNLKKAIRIIEEKKQEGELSDYLRQAKIEINYWRRLDKELHSSDSGSTISEMDVSIKEMIIQGEIALSKGEEIAAANFLSKALESGAESIRLNILKSRLLARNGNDSEAIGIYKEVRSVYNFSIDGPALWLAEAATDFLDYRFSLKILNQFMSRFGLIP